VHSLDKSTIEELERREPQIPTGYIMMFNLGHAPETTCDFVVMQELSYTRDLLDQVHAEGKSLLLWSVDDVPTMQNSLRDNVDGLISYKPDIVEEQRAEVEADTSVADRVDSYARRLLGW
jgi:glycerophosphoryl diester phosphodiesterase